MALKRIRARAFQEDIKDANSRVVQIDYAMQCLISVNNKVKSKVYYGQEEVWIYSPPLCTIMIKPKHFSSVQTIKKKNEFSNSIFLEYLYENELQHDGKVMKEVTNNKLLKIFN